MLLKITVTLCNRKLYLQISKNILTSLKIYAIILYAITNYKFTLEKYPRGRRGSPAKGVVRESVARVQIPLSPPLVNKTNPREMEFVLFFARDYFGLLVKAKIVSPISTFWIFYIGCILKTSS